MTRVNPDVWETHRACNVSLASLLRALALESRTFMSCVVYERRTHRTFSAPDGRVI